MVWQLKQQGLQPNSRMANSLFSDDTKEKALTFLNVQGASVTCHGTRMGLAASRNL